MNAPTSPIKPSERMILTPREFADVFGQHYSWAYRQIKAGNIKIVSKLDRIMIPRSEVDRFLQDQETYPEKGRKVHEKSTEI